MKTIRFFLLCIFTISIFSKIYAGDISDEAKYLFNNKVEISKIDSFFFHSRHEYDYNWGYVAKSLMKYKGDEAINLFKKMLNDNRIEFQNFSIFPLINAGEFNIGFTKFKEMVLNNEINILYNLYHSGNHSDFSVEKFELFKKHENEFIPFFKEICFNDSISYELKFRIADLLYNLGEEKEIELVCNEIIEQLPESNKKWRDQNPEEKSYTLLISYAKEKLKEIKRQK